MRQSLSAKCSILFNIPNSVNSSSADVDASRLSFSISQVRLHKLNRVSRSLVSRTWGAFHICGSLHLVPTEGNKSYVVAFLFFFV